MIKPGDTSEEILATEARWTRAFLEGDRELLADLMDESYHQIQPDGSVKTKAEVLATFEGDERHWEFAKSDEHQITLYGDTAVLIGRWRAKGVNHGEAFNYAARFVAVYVRRAEGWRIVSDQSTPITN